MYCDVVLTVDVVLPKVGRYSPSENDDCGAKIAKRNALLRKAKGEIRRPRWATLGCFEIRVIISRTPFDLDSESEDEADWNLLEGGTFSANEYNKQRKRTTDDREELKAVACRHAGSMCGPPTIWLGIFI